MNLGEWFFNNSNMYLTDEDRKTTSEWYRKHHMDTGCKLSAPADHQPERLIKDGTWYPKFSPIYEFTETGIGVVTVVKCPCGKASLDFTNYDTW